MDAKQEGERVVRDESSLLFEELGTVPIWAFSDAERQRVLSAVPEVSPDLIPWSKLAEIRSIFDDLHRRSRDRRSGNEHLLKKRRRAAATALDRIIKAADNLCAELDKAPQEVRSLLGWINLRSRITFKVRAGLGRRISLNETELPNVTRDTAELLASRAKELIPDLNTHLGKDRKLADREMAVDMLARVWIKTLGLPIYLIMHDDRADGAQPFVRFVEAVLNDVDPELSFAHAVRNVHRRLKALDRLRQ